MAFLPPVDRAALTALAEEIATLKATGRGRIVFVRGDAHSPIRHLTHHVEAIGGLTLIEADLAAGVFASNSPGSRPTASVAGDSLSGAGAVVGVAHPLAGAVLSSLGSAFSIRGNFPQQRFDPAYRSLYALLPSLPSNRPCVVVINNADFAEQRWLQDLLWSTSWLLDGREVLFVFGLGEQGSDANTLAPVVDEMLASGRARSIVSPAPNKGDIRQWLGHASDELCELLLIAGRRTGIGVADCWQMLLDAGAVAKTDGTHRLTMSAVDVARLMSDLIGRHISALWNHDDSQGGIFGPPPPCPSRMQLCELPF